MRAKMSARPGALRANSAAASPAEQHRRCELDGQVRRRMFLCVRLVAFCLCVLAYQGLKGGNCLACG